MRQKFLDFIFSYGLMGLGILFLFIASASIKTGNFPILKFPSSGERMNVEGGGDNTSANLPSSNPVVPLPIDKSEFGGKFSAIAVFAVDDITDTVLYEKNADATRPLASITKLMSVLVLADLPVQWSTTTIIQADDCEDNSKQIVPGEKFTLDDLWNIALIASSNSAVNAIVRSSGFSQEQFAVLMNRKAKELKLTSANFVEPTGLNAGNVASARDVASLLKESVRFNKICKAMHTAEYYAHPLNQQKARRVWTTNLLLTNWIPNEFDAEDIAGKTGYIGDSGYNFTVKLTNSNGHSIRVVILGASSSEARFTEARDLARWIFNHYLWPDDAGYDQLAE
ncbi:serine hydrolase [Patescibacteria group bacterium]|nr:serine hydrolase [Patescibacteria group bacterium]